MDIFNLEHAKVLYLRFCAIYDNKFVKTYHDDDFKSLWASEWSKGLSAINPNVIKNALDYCRKNIEWPPSIAEFIKICENYLGVPSMQKSLGLAINRDFNHPIVLLCYEKIGSWSMKNDTEKQLTIKFESAYQEALSKFRQDELATWQHLEEYINKPKELPAPEKLPSTGESAAFRECMNKCQEILQSKKITGSGKTYREFDSNAIKPMHHDYDKQTYNEYRDYLIAIPETETMFLPPTYAYDRSRFIGQLEQAESLRNQGYIPPTEREGFGSPKGSNNAKPTKTYKNWAHD